MVTGFILGFVVCYLLAYLERREMRDDYRKILNEFSIRTGGRTIYKPEKKDEKVRASDLPQNGFRILTPSMAETEAEDNDEVAERNGELSLDDVKHLQDLGVLPR